MLISNILHPMKRTSSPNHEQAVLRLARKRGLLHTRDIAALGVPTVVLTRRVRAGKLERAGRGVYALAEVAPRVDDIGTQAPFEVWLALPAGAAASGLGSPAIRIVRLSGGSLTQGIERIEVDGVKVPVFNAARTIVDCFKFRNKIGLDVALEALREGWRERKVNMDALWHYAS